MHLSSGLMDPKRFTAIVPPVSFDTRASMEGPELLSSSAFGPRTCTQEMVEPSLLWKYNLLIKKTYCRCLGGSVSWASDFGSSHDLMACEFELYVRICADSSESGA